MVDLGQMYKGCYRFLPGSSSNASECQHGGYLRAVQTVENVVFSCVPSLSTAARITIEMVQAMRAYSIAVAPRFIPDESRDGYCHGALPCRFAPARPQYLGSPVSEG